MSNKNKRKEVFKNSKQTKQKLKKIYGYSFRCEPCFATIFDVSV